MDAFNVEPVLSLAEFKDAVFQLPSRDAARWREAYIGRFVDRDSEFYKKHVGRLELHADGWCYEAYLWDCFRHPKATIRFEEIRRALLVKKALVFVMWDIHSCDKVLIPDYWKFEKASVLQLRSDLRPGNLRHLPEDIYIFDETMGWTLVLTHEDDMTGDRFCLEA